MRNLFVLHTQYNIILGTSIVLTLDKSAKNDLIVYPEFKVTEEYKHRLESLFDNIVYIRNSFEKAPSSLFSKQILFFREYNRFRRSVIADFVYDNVFLSQDRELDSLIFGYFKKKNSKCICSDIEEDCYYSINNILNSPHYVKPVGMGLIQKFRKIIFGTKYVYQDNTFFYGASSFFDDFYVLYPGLLRPQLRNKPTHEISSSAIVKAVNRLYSTDANYFPEADKYYIFFFDLIERYNNVDSIIQTVKNIYTKASSEGAQFLVKYHPREIDKFNLGNNICEIPSCIPAEKLLCDLFGKDVTVWGNATTAVIVANKLGLKSYSVARIDHSSNVVMLEQMKKMGVIIPTYAD